MANIDTQLTQQLTKLISEQKALLERYQAQNKALTSMLLNEVPENVDVQRYNEAGELVTVSMSNMAKLKSDFENWKTNAKSEYPFFTTMPNQQLLSTNNNRPDGYVLHHLSDANFSVINVVDGRTRQERTSIENELLTACGMSSNTTIPLYHLMNFNIVRVVWENITDRKYFYIKHHHTHPSITIGVWIKLISGSLSSCPMTIGHETGVWKLCGENIINPSSHNFHYLWDGIELTSDSGEMYFALPAVVKGFVDLTQNKWGFFPYVATY